MWEGERGLGYLRGTNHEAHYVYLKDCSLAVPAGNGDY